MIEPTPKAKADAGPDGPALGAGPANTAAAPAALIQEAVALHVALTDARARAHRLIGALRRHRKQSRLVASTLQSLKQMQLQEVAD